MKSFVGGLCLAAGLALLESIAAPSTAMCILNLFPDLRAEASAQPGKDDCIAACRIGGNRSRVR